MKFNQSPDHSPFVDGVMTKVKQYEAKQKRQQKLRRSVVIIFVIHTLLIYPGYLIKKPPSKAINMNHMTNNLIQSNQKIGITHQFGFNVGKAIKAS